MKKIIVRIGIVVTILVVVGLVVLFFLLNSIVKKGVETAGPYITKVNVTLGAAEISPFSGSGRLIKLFVGNPEGYKAPSAIEVEDIKVGVVPSSVTSDTIVINEVSLKGAVITLEGSLSGNNLSKILDNVNGSADQSKGATPATPQPAPPAKKTTKKFIVKDFLLEGAKVNLDITVPALGEKSLTLTLPTLHLQNIGQAEGGVTVEQLVQQVMKPLLASVTTAATEAVTNMAGQLKNNPEVNKAVKGVTDLFKK